MEPLTIINDRLATNYGKFNDKPKYRVSYSDDEYEKRLVMRTIEGLELLYPQVIELPKYNYIKNKYILEVLVPVPKANQHELTSRLSYEPLWVFEDRNKNPLPPKWEAIELILHFAMNKSGPPKDPDSGKSGDELIHDRMKRIDKIESELFGNDTPVTDALHYGTGISLINKQFNGDKK
jgi:hypothetical protein